MGFYRAIATLALILGSAFAYCIGQEKTDLFFFGLPEIQNYHPKDYKAHSQVWGITQDHEGRMYFGNGNGLIIYDGTTWLTIPNSTKGMIRRVGISQSGNIYNSGAGDLGLITRDYKENFKFNSLKEFLPKDLGILPFFRGQIALKNKVYFFSNSLILIWDENSKEFKSIRSEDNFLSMFLWQDRVVCSLRDSKDLLNLDDENQIELPKRIVLSKDERLTSSERSGNDLILMTQMSLYLDDGVETTRIDKEIQVVFEKDYVNTIYPVSDGKIVVGTDIGLYIIDKNGQLLQTIGEEEGLVSRRVHFCFEDMEGNLWVSTDRGISKLRFQQPFRFFDDRKGLPGIVNDILIKDDHVFVSTHEGVYFHNGEENFKPLLDPNFEAFKLLDLGEDMLIASTKGIFRYSFLKKDLEKLFPDYAYKIFRSRVFEGKIYICSTKGLKSFRFSDGKVHDFQNHNDLVGEFVRFIEEEEDGTLWLGSTQNPLYRIKWGNRIRLNKYMEENGLPTSEIKINRTRNGLLFSSLEGVYRFDGNRFQRHPDFLYDTLMVPYIFQSYLDPIIYLFYGNTPFMSLKAYQWDKGYKYLDLPELKGFVSSGIWMGVENEFGKIFLGTTDGLIGYDPKAPTDQNMPEMILRSLQIRDTIFVKNWSPVWGSISKNPPEVNYPKNSIKAEFACLSFENETQNQYRYRLKGFDEEWSEWSFQSAITYQGLFEGNYELEAQSKNTLGIESRIVQIPFVVLPPWYRSTLFLIAAGFCLLVFVTLIVRYFSRINLKRKLRELELKQRIQDERERISSNLHDHVGAQLTSIISGIKLTERIDSLKKDEKALHLLESLKGDAEESISNLRDTIWTLNKGSVSHEEFFAELKHDIQKLTQYSRLKLEFEDDIKGKGKVGPNIAFNLKQIIKEITQNILKHSKADNASFRIHSHGTNSLEIQVCDDGKGFDPKKEGASPQKFGLKNIRNRIEKLGGKLRIESSPDNGTKILIKT